MAELLMPDPLLPLIQEGVEQGMIFAHRHWCLPLTVYNYSFECQMSRNWNEATMACRGLVLNDNGDVVARPFRKFFNDDEPNPERVPWDEPFEIYEKLDGSLITLFYYGRDWWTASRSRFDSEQALIANDIIKCKYRHVLSELDPDLTYVFELIYPANRIVVNYGDTKELFLLGAVRNDGTGEYIPDSANIPGAFAKVKTYPASLGNVLEQLREHIPEGNEGFVIRFASGLRLKVKSESYRSLHRILTELTNKRIWEHLSADNGANYIARSQQLQELLDSKSYSSVSQWAKEWISKYVFNFEDGKVLVRRAIDRCNKLTERKSMAALIHEECGPYVGAAFAGLDGKPYDHLIWKAMKPEKIEKPPRGVWLKPE